MECFFYHTYRLLIPKKKKILRKNQSSVLSFTLREKKFILNSSIPKRPIEKEQ